METTTESTKILNSAGAYIDPATEATLAAIKAQTDKLTFSGSNLEVTTSAISEFFFSRILNGNFHDDEQFKRDAPQSSYANAFEYLGVALATALDADATWAVVRVEYDSVGNEVAKRIRLNIEWAQRTAGW